MFASLKCTAFKNWDKENKWTNISNFFKCVFNVDYYLKLVFQISPSHPLPISSSQFFAKGKTGEGWVFGWCMCACHLQKTEVCVSHFAEDGGVCVSFCRRPGVSSGYAITILYFAHTTVKCFNTIMLFSFFAVASMKYSVSSSGNPSLD